MLRALVYALAAQTALLKVNVSQVVLKGDGLKRACLDALAAAYAGNVTSLLGNGTLILVYAAYIYPAVQFVLVTEFDDIARAGLGASTAGSALVLINHRKSRLGIHVDGIELTCLDTVAATQAAKETAGLTAVHHGGYCAALGSVIGARSGTVLA